MSIRASIVSFFFRRTVRKQMAEIDDPAAIREQMSQPLGKTPEKVAVEPVDAGGVVAEWVSWPGCSPSATIIYFHGGGYVFGSPAGHRDIAWRLSKEGGVRVLMVDYRLAPEHPFPAAVEDATAVYRWLLEQGTDPAEIVVSGDSAGGGLAVSLMVNIRNLGLPQPKAAVLLSPWADMTATSDSMTRNANADAVLSPEAIRRFAELYIGHDRDPKAPLASPVFADLSGMPPVLILVGDTEVLLSDSEQLAAKLREAGGEVTLNVWPGMQHVFPILARILPEAKQAVRDISAFVREHLGTTELS
ncbi:MAG: alpha/beta hydrolase [Pseudomonadales bacterium]|nr:alpha/beta hydrolase [Pseudomonadales bacterium]